MLLLRCYAQVYDLIDAKPFNTIQYIAIHKCITVQSKTDKHGNLKFNYLRYTIQDNNAIRYKVIQRSFRISRGLNREGAIYTSLCFKFERYLHICQNTLVLAIVMAFFW